MQMYALGKLMDDSKKRALKSLWTTEIHLSNFMEGDGQLTDIEYLEAKMVLRYIDKLLTSLLRLEQRRH